MRNALGGVRICDFSGQLAGAGATRFLAAMGAEVIRVEDPVTEGYWDVLRGVPPFVDERRGTDFGGPFNNHNVEKLGVTLNLRTEAGKDLLRELIAVCDVFTENFAPGVMERLGFSYEVVRSIKEDVVYVSNSGFGQVGPYRDFKTWGPLVQASCGLAFSTGLAGQHPAGIGYSYMDHHGANVMAIAIMAGLLHRARTGEGQWIDISCTDAGAFLNGPAVLDFTVNSRPMRRPGSPDSNHSQGPLMAPHAIYPARARTTGSLSPAVTITSGGHWLRSSTRTGAGRRDGTRAPGACASSPSSIDASASGPRPSTASNWPRHCAPAASRLPRCSVPPNGSTTIPPRPTGACGRRSPTRAWAGYGSTASRSISRRPTG